MNVGGAFPFRNQVGEGIVVIFPFLRKRHDIIVYIIALLLEVDLPWRPMYTLRVILGGSALFDPVRGKLHDSAKHCCLCACDSVVLF